MDKTSAQAGDTVTVTVLGLPDGQTFAGIRVVCADGSVLQPGDRFTGWGVYLHHAGAGCDG